MFSQTLIAWIIPASPHPALISFPSCVRLPPSERMPIMQLFLSAIQFSKDDSTQWVVLCVGVLATLYLVMRGRSKGKKDPLSRKPVPFGVSQQRQIERDIGNLMVEMLQTAQQMTAQLDTRATRLEVLLKEADEKLALMKRATATIASPSTPPTSPADMSAIAPTLAALTPQELEKPEIPPDPRHRDIYSLADQGRSPVEIARHLNRPNGEVELILALRPQ
jgi:hypothetical protein